MLKQFLGLQVHDAGHDGFTNAFHKQLVTRRALAHNDQSIQARVIFVTVIIIFIIIIIIIIIIILTTTAMRMMIYLIVRTFHQYLTSI